MSLVVGFDLGSSPRERQDYLITHSASCLLGVSHLKGSSLKGSYSPDHESEECFTQVSPF